MSGRSRSFYCIVLGKRAAREGKPGHGRELGHWPEGLQHLSDSVLQRLGDQENSKKGGKKTMESPGCRLRPIEDSGGAQLAACVEHGGTGTFGPISCHIVNYDSDHTLMNGAQMDGSLCLES